MHQSADMTLVRSFTCAALLSVPAVALAQNPSPQFGGGGTGASVFEEETTYDFEDDYVEGQLVRPDGELVTGQRHGKQSSLIRIRADFIPEMVQSVEDL